MTRPDQNPVRLARERAARDLARLDRIRVRLARLQGIDPPGQGRLLLDGPERDPGPDPRAEEDPPGDADQGPSRPG